MSKLPRINDAEYLAALDRLAAGEKLKDVVASLPIGEPAFRWRYRQMFGAPLRLTRKQYPDFVAPTDPCVRAYMAGIIDGEGWVSRHKNASWTVAFSSTDQPLVDFFAQHGGRVYRRFDGTFRKGTLGSVKPQWTWSVHSRMNILAFLGCIRPYMVIKGAKADQCVEELRARLAGHLRKEAEPPKAEEFATPVLHHARWAKNEDDLRVLML